MWGSESGNRKLLADDHDYAVEIYDGLACEMYVQDTQISGIRPDGFSSANPDRAIIQRTEQPPISASPERTERQTSNSIRAKKGIQEEVGLEP